VERLLNGQGNIGGRTGATSERPWLLNERKSRSDSPAQDRAGRTIHGVNDSLRERQSSWELERKKKFSLKVPGGPEDLKYIPRGRPECDRQGFRGGGGAGTIGGARFREARLTQVRGKKGGRHIPAKSRRSFVNSKGGRVERRDAGAAAGVVPEVA